MFAWLLFTAAVCVVLGIVLTLWVEWTLLSQPANARTSDDDPDSQFMQTDCPIELPKVCILL